MSGEDSKSGGKNQGEGNREAAKAYNQETQRFVKAGKVESSAADAKAAVEGAEKAELEEAEKIGRAHAKEFDPNVKRDR